MTKTPTKTSLENIIMFGLIVVLRGFFEANKVCWAFSLFVMVYEIIHPLNVGQWKIFVVLSGDNTSRKKYFESHKSPTHFDVLISEEHFGQISLKSGKSTYPINSFEYGEFTQKQKLCFRS